MSSILVSKSSIEVSNSCVVQDGDSSSEEVVSLVSIRKSSPGMRFPIEVEVSGIFNSSVSECVGEGDDSSSISGSGSGGWSGGG